MQTFTGIEYIKIDLANHFGLDKEVYETRIQWVDDNEDNLETITDADEPAMFAGALMAYRKAQIGIATGYMVGFDAVSSGVQLMGVMVNCITTAMNTGLIHQDVRSDLYTTGQHAMNDKLASKLAIPRADMKQAIMTYFYGSKAEPEALFGEDTDELKAFYSALRDIAPGAVKVMNMLLNAWQPYALDHSWYLPDGYHAYVPVNEHLDMKVEVDELAHATFTHRVEINQGSQEGLSLAANIVHSVDGMVVREMNRRCNHLPEDFINEVITSITTHLVLSGSSLQGRKDYSTFISVVELERIGMQEVSISDFTDAQLRVLVELANQVLEYKTFPIVCVHDEFKCHANHMNVLRKHYALILAQIAKSNILQDILSQVTNTTYYVPKMGNIADQIAQSNYGIS